MTEFLAFLLSETKLRSLILSKGYGGGDKARMLQ
jgi:hypothetical protein